MQSALSNLDYVCMRLNEDLRSLQIDDALANPIPSFASLNLVSQDMSFTEVEKNAGFVSIGIDEVNDPATNTVLYNKDAQRFRKRTTMPHHYFIRISPVALKASKILPSFNTCDNFQLVAWKSPEGHIKANVSCDEVMEFIDPAKDGAYIIQCINHYMATHARDRLFLYIRVPDNDTLLGEIGDQIIELCALFAELQECFEGMDVAWHPVS